MPIPRPSLRAFFFILVSPKTFRRVWAKYIYIYIYKYIYRKGYAGGLDGRRSQRRIVNIKRVRSNAKS